MNEIIEIVVGAVLPPFIDLINKRVANSTIRYIFSLLICLIIGVAASWQDLNWQDVLTSGALVFASAQTVYKTYYKDSKLQATLRK